MELQEPCRDPVEIPEPVSGAKLPQKKAEYYWILDRKNLIECNDRNLSLVEFYRARDSMISGKDP